MKKICIVTTTRAEYGHLKWVINEIYNDPSFTLQLIVTGAHLSEEQGNTVEAIYGDGYPIALLLDVDVDNSTKLAIARTMSRIGKKMADAFDALKPDTVVALGDRYELFPICFTAFVMDIPIVHISGGDVTEGAIDDNVRNAITMISSYHFPSTQDSANNIIRMRNSNKNVFVVGELSLDLFNHIDLMPRSELSNELNIDQNKRWVLLTYHPETKKEMSYNMKAIQNIITVLQNIPDIEIIITKANMDYGGQKINSYWELISTKFPGKFKLFASLGQLRYLSLMKQVSFVIGNSSSGIVETPFLSIPAINVGNRQKGRYHCKNIILTGIDVNEIKAAIEKIEKNDEISDKYYWGDGKTAEKIIRILKNA
jgi:UDP-hydrolysing UDP-N-acetyl-D-glucosamine 2-epimerase